MTVLSTIKRSLFNFNSSSIRTFVYIRRKEEIYAVNFYIVNTLYVIACAEKHESYL